MEKELEKLRHSCSHVMAQAVRKLFPKAKLGIGPATEDGFYYDFDNVEFKEEDLEKIEKEMQNIIKENHAFKKVEVTKKEAEKMLKGEQYKLELLDDVDGKITFFQNGDFSDLCKGPHVKSTGDIKAFKLMRIAGAYWKGDSKRPMLQRIYGIAFDDKKKLRQHLHMLKEAEKRNHIKLGKELDLFVINETVGKGLPLLTPKGATIKRELRRFIVDEELRRGYVFTETPILAKSDLYQISGHLDHYKQDMFVFEANGEEMVLRPMTCPHQFMIYKSRMRSYKDLPLRYAEIAELFRNEQTGELHGLIRIRQFTLADAHIICSPDQLEKEFEGVVDLVQYVMKTLGFKDYWYRFSKWDPKKKDKYIDNPKAWNDSQKIMKKIIDKLKLKYDEADGEAAFYGPKLDVQMRNVYGKEDTIFTIQIDFALPERFDMTYEGKDGRKHRPMVIHRSSIGCLERTMAMLIENYAGKLPIWLSPVHAVLLTVSDKNNKYAKTLFEKMQKSGFRVELDDRSESIGKKVRDAQVKKIPLILVLGDKEVKNNTVSVRTLDGKTSFGVKIDDFLDKLKENIDKREINTPKFK